MDGRTNSQLCWNCKKSIRYPENDCEWANSFEPVPGWTAKPTCNKGISSYSIRECPKFELDDKPIGKGIVKKKKSQKKFIIDESLMSLAGKPKSRITKKEMEAITCEQHGLNATLRISKTKLKRCNFCLYFDGSSNLGLLGLCSKRHGDDIRVRRSNVCVFFKEKEEQE